MLTIALIGSWAVDQTIENVIVTLAFGVIGHLMARLDYPRLPIVISLVLGSSIERDFFQSMMISNGSWQIFVTRPVSCLDGLVVLALAALRRRRRWVWARHSVAPAASKGSAMTCLVFSALR